MIQRVMNLVKGIMFKKMHGMITCVEFESFILDYLEGELPEGQRKIFEFHMRICRECREYLAAYQRSIELGQKVFTADDDLPADVPEDLVKAILDAKER